MSLRRFRPSEFSDVHRRCVIEATIDPLVRFPRGFARSKAGPFFVSSMVKRLTRNGFLRAMGNDKFSARTA